MPAADGGASGAAPAPTAAARIGPNAVTRLAEALAAEGGDALALQVFSSAGLAPWLDTPPEAMVRETEAARLHRLVAACLPAPVAERVLADAGERTARYIMAHRIPRVARGLLHVLPRALAGPLLLSAIERNAWTFAGSGTVTTDRGRPWRIAIADNPLAVPGCPWHRAVFRELFGTLVCPSLAVHHPACRGRGDGACVFEISVPGRE